MAPGLAGVLGFIGVTLIISFVHARRWRAGTASGSGCRRPEATAALFSPALNRVAAICRPIIWLLSRSTDLLVRVLGGDPSTGREAIGEEELRGTGGGPRIADDRRAPAHRRRSSRPVERSVSEGHGLRAPGVTCPTI